MTGTEYRSGGDPADRLDDELDRMVRGERPETGAARSGFGPTIEEVFALASAAGMGAERSAASTRQSPSPAHERRSIRPLPDRTRRFPMSVTSTAAIVAIVIAITFSTFQSLGTDPSRHTGSQLAASTQATPEATPSVWVIIDPDDAGTDCTIPARGVSFGIPQGSAEEGSLVETVTSVPASLFIEEAQVHAEIERGNIIDGIMDFPFQPSNVTWYQQTALLGEVGNVVMAGYPDAWDVGPTVFANLYDLEDGDEIVATGTDGSRYVYTIEWVELYDIVGMTSETAQKIIGQTPDKNITLITCGGEFDYQRGQYLSRVVVRGTLTKITAGTPVPVP